MKLRLSSVARFTRQMATYQDSFVEIRKALESLSKGAKDARTRNSLARVHDRVQEGDSLYEAFSREGDRYPQIFLRMTKVGEESGTLAAVYTQLASYLEERVAMRSRFLWKLAYPAFMVLAAIVILSVLTAVTGAIGEQGGMDWAKMESVFIWTVAKRLGIVVGAVALFFIIRRLLWGRSLVDAVILYVPGLSGAFRKQMMARFSFSMGLMTGSAIGMPEAVTESGRATNNGYASWLLEKAGAELVEGVELTEALRETRLFPQEFMDVVEVAEQSGKISESMSRLAPRYSEDADIAMNRLLSGIAMGIYLGVMLIMAWKIITLYAHYISNLTGLMG